MTYTIDNNLKKAVEGFAWVEQPKSGDYIADAPLEELINKIAQKIIAASDLRPRLAAMAGREELSVTTLEASYWIVQDKDKATHETLNKINAAGDREKHILSRIFLRLSSPEYFKQLPADDVKGLTLLWGIKEIAADVLAQPPVQNSLESQLMQLRTLRSKYDIEKVTEPVKQFLLKIDEQITNIQKQIEEKTPVASAPKKMKLDDEII